MHRFKVISPTLYAVCQILLGGFAIGIGKFPPVITPPQVVSDGLVVGDMAGRSVHLGGVPDHIVTAAQLIPPFVTLSGSSSAIRATTDVGKSLAASLLDKLFPLGDAISAAGRVNRIEPELVLRAEPDAILAWDYQSETLIKMGFPYVVTFKTTRPLLKSHLATWKLLAALSGEQAVGTSLRVRYDNLIDAETKTVSQSAMRKPRVLIIMSGIVSGVDRIWIGPRGHYLDERFTLAGSENAVRGRVNINAQFSIEDVARLDPDVILIETFFDNLKPNDLYADPIWRMIRAVRDAKVYRVPPFPILTVPVFDPLLIEWLAELFHSDTMPMHLRASLQSTYRDVYRYELTDDEIDELLDLPANRTSWGYKRFMREKPAPSPGL